MKTPYIYKESYGERNQRVFETYNVPDKYMYNPISFFNKLNLEGKLRKLNSRQNACLVTIERDAGTEIFLATGDTGRQLIINCLEKQWDIYFIVPGVSVSVADRKPEPGFPVEIKIYFFDTLDKGAASEEKIKLNLQYQIHEAFKSFYSFAEVEVSPDLINSIIQGKDSFYKIQNIDKLKYVAGKFTLTTKPQQKPIENPVEEPVKETTEKV